MLGLLTADNPVGIAREIKRMWNRDLVPGIRSLRPVAGPGIRIERTAAGTLITAENQTGCRRDQDFYNGYFKVAFADMSGTPGGEDASSAPSPKSGSGSSPESSAPESSAPPSSSGEAPSGSSILPSSGSGSSSASPEAPSSSSSPSGDYIDEFYADPTFGASEDLGTYSYEDANHNWHNGNLFMRQAGGRTRRVVHVWATPSGHITKIEVGRLGGPPFEPVFSAHEQYENYTCTGHLAGWSVSGGKITLRYVADVQTATEISHAEATWEGSISDDLWGESGISSSGSASESESASGSGSLPESGSDTESDTDSSSGESESSSGSSSASGGSSSEESGGDTGSSGDPGGEGTVLAVFDGADPDSSFCGFADVGGRRISYPRTVFSGWRREQTLYVYAEENHIRIGAAYPTPSVWTFRRLLARLLYRDGAYSVIQEQHGPIIENLQTAD